MKPLPPPDPPDPGDRLAPSPSPTFLGGPKVGLPLPDAPRDAPGVTAWTEKEEEEEADGPAKLGDSDIRNEGPSSGEAAPEEEAAERRRSAAVGEEALI